MTRPDPTASLLGALGGLDELAPGAPLLWPEIPVEDAAAEWQELRTWVHGLVARYALDSHVVPACWFRHNHLVEALAALRDHERGCFAATSPPTAAIEWQRAWRDIESRLRAWTAELRCDSHHHPAHDQHRGVSEDGWENFVTADSSGRRLKDY